MSSWIPREGRFQIPGIHVGSRVAIYVNKRGYAGGWSTRIDVKDPNETEELNVRLKPAAGQISGRVVDAAGEPVADAIVHLNDIDPIETQSDSQGRFELREVPDGELWLRVLSEHGRVTREVRAGDRDLELTIES